MNTEDTKNPEGENTSLPDNSAPASTNDGTVAQEQPTPETTVDDPFGFNSDGPAPATEPNRYPLSETDPDHVTVSHDEPALAPTSDIPDAPPAPADVTTATEPTLKESIQGTLKAIGPVQVLQNRHLYTQDELLEYAKEVRFGYNEAVGVAILGQAIGRDAWSQGGPETLEAFVSYSPGNIKLPAKDFWSTPNQVAANLNGGYLTVSPNMTFCAEGHVIVGWEPKEQDKQATDWKLVGLLDNIAEYPQPELLSLDRIEVALANTAVNSSPSASKNDTVIKKVKLFRRLIATIEQAFDGDQDLSLRRIQSSLVGDNGVALAITKLKEARFWLGSVLSDLDEANPYPESTNPSNTIIEPQADGPIAG
jgi:hypothetical protein